MNLQTDSANCGACGRACGSGQMCTAGACGGCGASVSFAAQVQPIFTNSCTVGCHSGTRPADGMDLSAGRAFAMIVGVR